MLDFVVVWVYNCSMEELRMVIANNLMNLRKASKLTQLELAEKLNYSDKAISKWERGESLPDVILLKQIADMYNVSIDYMMQEHTFDDAKKHKPKAKLNNKLIITLLSCLVVWVCATIIYVNLTLIMKINYWMIWLWALPVTAIVLIVFASIWGKRWQIITSVSVLVWSLLASCYLQFLKYNIWTIFLLGIPLQIATLLSGKMKK